MMPIVPDREQKYDRQLRLWGSDGQNKLENSHLCVIGAGPEATEAIKNLVLPGIGIFTVIDSNLVTSRDLANNFFVTEKDIGKPRASTISNLLHELNTDVKSANYIVQDPAELIERDPNFVAKYSFIIVTGLLEESLLRLSEACRINKIPLAWLRIYGLIGYLRLQILEHNVIESKPDFPIFDLRLSDPFPELVSYAKKVDFASINSREHAHVPFPVILIRAMEIWKSNNKIVGNILPRTEMEKTAYKKIIAEMSRNPEEENFAEAIKNALNAYFPYNIPVEVKKVLENPKAKNLDSSSSDFWIVVSAVRSFVENEGEGRLPLLGIIPDMVAETATYIDIQNIYSEKAERDRDVVIAYTTKALESIGKAHDSISKEYIGHICKNATFLRSVVYRSIADEFNPDTKVKVYDWQVSDPSTNMNWYFLIRAADRFRAQFGHFPSEDLDHDWEIELAPYCDILKLLLRENNLSEDSIQEEYVREFLRYGGSQIHNVGAIMGGVCAQEVVKILTGQWMPLDNTFIFNGIESTSSVYKM